MKILDKIYVAGHNGLVGSALVRRLRSSGYTNLALAGREQLDLEVRDSVAEFFEREQPDYVFLAAAKVGGILANSELPADFIRSNLVIQMNVIDAAYRNGVKGLLFLGSSCIYPRLAPQPIKEEYLLSGPLEPTNQAYAIAKIAGIELCRAYNAQYGTRFVSVMPTNLYGPGDDFDLQSSHVIPALLRKFAEATAAGAPTVTVWGTGQPRREFLHVDDMADACVFLMERAVDPKDIINIGFGEDISILDLAELIREVVGYQGEILFDATKPDGMPRKLLDSSRLRALGWQPRIGLREGLAATYEWLLSRSEVEGMRPATSTSRQS